MRPQPLEDFGIRWLSGPRSKGDLKMRYLKYLALLAVLAVPLAYSQAQVAVGVGVNVGPRYADYDSAGGPPVCPYGYYSYYPYACAPYGYYGPRWFVGGVFIGAGPWYHWGHVGYWGRGGRGHPGYWNRGYYGRGYWSMDTSGATTGERMPVITATEVPFMAMPAAGTAAAGTSTAAATANAPLR